MIGLPDILRTGLSRQLLDLGRDSADPRDAERPPDETHQRSIGDSRHARRDADGVERPLVIRCGRACRSRQGSPRLPLRCRTAWPRTAPRLISVVWYMGRYQTRRWCRLVQRFLVSAPGRAGAHGPVRTPASGRTQREGHRGGVPGDADAPPAIEGDEAATSLDPAEHGQCLVGGRLRVHAAADQVGGGLRKDDRDDPLAVAACGGRAGRVVGVEAGADEGRVPHPAGRLERHAAGRRAGGDVPGGSRAIAPTVSCPNSVSTQFGSGWAIRSSQIARSRADTRSSGSHVSTPVRSANWCAPSPVKTANGLSRTRRASVIAFGTPRTDATEPTRRPRRP